MRQMVEQAGLSDRIVCDSAGTIGYHAGERADPRMRQAAHARGYAIDGVARQITSSDFARFDLILAMDRENFRTLKRLDKGENHAAKICMFCEFCKHHDISEVPDPYYGGSEGFEYVLDLLEDGCSELIRQIEPARIP